MAHTLKEVSHSHGRSPPTTQDDLKKLCADSFLCRDTLCVKDDHKQCVPRNEAIRALSLSKGLDRLPQELQAKIRWHGSVSDFNLRFDRLSERIQQAFATGHPSFETVEQLLIDLNSIQHDMDDVSPRMGIATQLKQRHWELLRRFIALTRLLSDADFWKLHFRQSYDWDWDHARRKGISWPQFLGGQLGGHVAERFPERFLK